ncbi:SMP-30/gluconolactonase/LRE family protein [Aureimonas phyllosphaerae]|uniref:Lactonase n=1 Tax=Aureimonas phyllosphaerae TaxID=1166078 RepID=A0A7W6FW83_9HYPH|nr:SMP-30/gluconolactonase/LRE family protein [Aureimonas phyllosphaerae]MBB3938054.1 lactonase [Aureimonas phyllosphaerae]MBB3962070.1 lactonase [Aureimonas phyllosphaerae]SFF55082.1 lactonase [Aureimonas phyllosphaerae]
MLTGREPNIPIWEKSLPTIVAETWFTVTKDLAPLGGVKDRVILEGPRFDKQGNLIFVDCMTGRVLRLSPDRELTAVLTENTAGAAGLDFDGDGRIVVAGFTTIHSGGTVFAIKPDGSDKQIIIDPQVGHVPDDLVYDQHGGFYFTDMQGNNANPTGGVYYVAPDLKTITPILPNLSLPNGIGLSPDEKILWATETGRGLLHRIELAGPTTIADYGLTIAYRFTGAKVDSLRTDANGNVYVALYTEGRLLVFDWRGVPIAQVLIPERKQGGFLGTTSLAVHPDTGEIFITTNDDIGGTAAIYRADALSAKVLGTAA